MRDDSIKLVVRQDISGEVPLTVSTREVTDITFDKFKEFFLKFFESTKDQDSQIKMTNPEKIDGCDIIFTKMDFSWPMDNRAIIGCTYCIPFEDGSFTFVSSSRGNEDLKIKY